MTHTDAGFVLVTKAAPSGRDKTLPHGTWEELPDLSATVTTYVRSNLAITVSGEVGGRRVFLRALIDDRPASPSDVLFTAESFEGVRSFTFVAEGIEAGLHTVRIEWLEDAGGATAKIGDRTLTVLASASPSPDLGGLSVTAAQSGDTASTTSSSWVDVPGMARRFRIGTAADLSVTLAAEAGGHRVFVRALVDGQAAEPSDVLLATESLRGTRSFTFTRENLPPGNHDIRMQWYEDGSGTATMKDRTLSVLALPRHSSGGGLTVAAAPSGPDVGTTSRAWAPVPNLARSFSTDYPCDLAVTVSGEAGGGRMFVRAMVDGHPAEPNDVLFMREEFDGIRSFTFSLSNLEAGEHEVRVEWRDDSGQTSSFGDRSLTLAYGPFQPDLVQPYAHLGIRWDRRRVAVILWDPQRPTDPAAPRAAIESAFTGASNSLKQYFREASLGRFDFDVAAFLPPASAGGTGWYPANKPATHYWGAADPTDADGDGFTTGHTEKWAEAVWKAANDFNLDAQDSDGDGILEPQELLICMMIPQNRQEGYQRTPAGQQFPVRKALRSRGVASGAVIPTILEIYIGNPPHVGLMFHELAHLLLDAPDMYHGWPPDSEYVPFAAGPYSLMATGMPGNLDPFLRLKYGWLRHRFAHRAGTYTLPAAVTSGHALILLDPAHGTREYFIVENRWAPRDTCDARLPDQGLAVWHVIEDPAVFNATPVPNGTNAVYWASTSGQWSRRGVRLIRPVVTPPNHQNTQALWDGSDPATGYDLLSSDPNPAHSELRWAGGGPSGFAIRNIGAAGGTTTVDLEVPW